ncbi:MAG: MFS transporter [Planctomycetaceae bacterium]|nr:MFS transporter [Planctomycetaceae bacterium]
MPSSAKAVRIRLADFRSAPMRAFHMSWFAFFTCFIAWFGIAPLMSIVRDELSLTKDQIGWCIIGSVAVTVLVRLAIGRICDAVGPRIAYTWLLILGAFPVTGIAFANDFTSFLIFRVLIGAIGASFVITQFHTSLMFAPNCVGTANATTAGWGNLGGGVTQFVMPALFAMFIGLFGLSDAWGWRASMIVAGVAILLTGIAYFFLTQDTPEGNYAELRAAGKLPSKGNGGSFADAAKDSRVWALFVLYGACFGIELTINNVAALYFTDYFGMGVATAGLAASAFGLMNLFARTLGGVFGDKFGATGGLKGRVKWLFACVFVEGLCLMLFSQMNTLMLALPALILFSLFVQMSEGATYSVVPFINKKSLGTVAGIVGAGGNAGAVAAGFLFKGALDWQVALLILGAAVTLCSFAAFAVRFAPATEEEAARDFEAAVEERRGLSVATA